MAQASNNNIPASKPGDSFYPEMGGWHDGTALFVVQHGYGGYYLSWQLDRHDEALATFKALRIRPRDMHRADLIKGGVKWSCGVTWDAGSKIVGSKYAVLEMLLD